MSCLVHFTCINLVAQWRRNYEDRGYIVPPSSGLVPPVPPSQRCGLCQIFKQTTLTTRLYKVLTNLYPPHLRKRSDVLDVAPIGVAKYCDERLFVFVCVFASVSPERYVRSSSNSLCMLSMAVARFFGGGAAICYVFPVL